MSGYRLAASDGNWGAASKYQQGSPVDALVRVSLYQLVHLRVSRVRSRCVGN